MNQPPHRIVISRTDSIGDVILTLPLAGLLKKQFPGCAILFFGRTYTQPVIHASEYVDEFINYDNFEKLKTPERKKFLKNVHADAIVHVFPRQSIAEASKDAEINIRIGTTNRIYHWWTCNRLIALSRKNSALHEAQLNAKLLKPLGIRNEFQLNELKDYFGLSKIHPLSAEFKIDLSKEKFNLVLHPKSNTSAREWSLEHYSELIDSLPEKNFNIIITGTEKEKTAIAGWLKSLPPHVRDYTGKMTLGELISFIQNSDGLVAASTGPLHIAASLGKYALGIFPPIRPMHPGRWAPLGKYAEFLVADKTCSDCRNNPTNCHCMNEITPAQVAEKILRWKKN